MNRIIRKEAKEALRKSRGFVPKSKHSRLCDDNIQQKIKATRD